MYERVQYENGEWSCSGVFYERIPVGDCDKMTCHDTQHGRVWIPFADKPPEIKDGLVGWIKK